MGVYFAILDVQINNYPHTKHPNMKRFYSYFYDTQEEYKHYAYSEAIEWLQTEFNLIIDTKLNKIIKDAQEKLQIAVRNRTPVSLIGGGGELGNLKP
jgi:hypothetical protein